jgi:hypothetical protein
VSDEPGFTPDEIDRGEDRAWHLGKWGCLIAVIILAIVIAVFWRAVATSTDL